MKTRTKAAITIVLITSVFCTIASAELRHIGTKDFADNIIIPQSRAIAFAPDNRPAIEITQVDMLIDIIESASTTTVELTLKNNTHSRQEAELIFPVPDKAVARGFAYDGPGGEITAKILPKAEAEEIYRRLVAKIKDPALVEFAGYNMIRSNVFPIEPHKATKVRLTYEHLLTTEDNRIDYILPRSESLSYNVPWNVTANIKAKSPISTVYSSSHQIEIKRKGKNEVTVKIADESNKEPGPFRLSYLLEKNGLTASMFAYPDDKTKGGYFLLLAGLPAETGKNEEDIIKRELTIVIDRSGSMRGEKIEQVKEAALQVISGLKNGEAFNIITYSDRVEWFSDEPVIKNEKNEKAAQAYIGAINANGGTNLHEALKTALKQKPSYKMLPIVLFLTDGLPTVGDTSEVSIRNLVIESNAYERRVFTFGVGVDLNAPLLDKIASESRAKSNYALPGEDVEAKIGKVFRQLSGPVLADVELGILDSDGDKAVGRVQDLMPNEMPDLFEGDQLVLLGRYIGDKPITFRLTGNYLGKERTFQFKFDFDTATEKNGFVPRLWASRRIAELIEQVRQLGADSGTGGDDPKVKELVDEIVRLSTEFGILTEYTAFLAKEGTDLAEPEVVRERTQVFLKKRAMDVRHGLGAVSQSENLMSQKGQTKLNYRNEYFDKEMRRVSVSNIQQINDRAYYLRGNRWIDSRLVKQADKIKPDKVIEYGSPEFMELLKKLTVSNRQGSVALGGEVLLLVDSQTILVKNN